MSGRVIDRWKWACTVAAPRLNGTQRAVLHVLVAHAPSGSTVVGQDTMADSAGITERAVRPALEGLEVLGLIAGEHRPGKTTVWTVNMAWTSEADFQGDRPRKGIGPRKSTSAPPTPDPGSTPEVPRKYPETPLPTKGEVEELQHPLSLNPKLRDGMWERVKSSTSRRPSPRRCR